MIINFYSLFLKYIIKFKFILKNLSKIILIYKNNQFKFQNV